MKKSVFLHEAGNTATNRIWDFLIVHSEYDYSMKDIAKFSLISYSILKLLWKDFQDKNIVVQTRTVGKAKMFKLNMKSKVVNRFIDYYWAVVEDSVKRKNERRKKNLDTVDSSARMSVYAKGL